jgi:ATP-dependent DNA helicase RecG
LLDLAGVGRVLAAKLAAAGIRTPDDLGATYPRDYKDWRQPAAIADIVRGALGRRTRDDEVESSEEIAVGRITRVNEFRGRIPIVSAELEDATGHLKVTWFGRRGFSGKVQVGDRMFVHGRAQVKRTRGAVGVELNVLHHRILRDDEEYHGAIVPIYRASKDLSSREIAKLIERNLDRLEPRVRDVLPPSILRKRKFGSMREAWRELHRPSSLESAAAARERAVYEEFFSIALAAALRRARRHASGGAAVMVAPSGLLDEFERTVGVDLTGAQRRVIAQIWGDMAQTAPMNRLLQGDVGSGKTLVAAAAIVLAARSGMQSALMAPTEILAAQHARKLAPLLLPFGVRVDALFGSIGARERAATRGRLAAGECDLAVGTHALIEENVEFKRLGLAIIDEQHRFGVAQRAALRSKSRAPHTLHMTATPIPRSLAQTKFADLDLSIIDELPPGRTPIVTYALRESRKMLAYEFVRKNVARGRQAFIVAPAIDESEMALTSAIAELEVLRRDVFPELRVGLLHGRLPSREKDEVMARFVRGEADVLMATTVVEVGVDVPNASVMVILDAHRYGLAQLHQLRGRVGRGAARSYCLLISPDGPASESARLDVLERTNDGFEIAEQDLRLRKGGEFAGTLQAGSSDTLLGDFADDFALYMRAKADADELVAQDPELTRPEHRPLRDLAGEDANARAVFVSS